MNVISSPLFEPVSWSQDGFKILDETLLPDRIAYIEAADTATALMAVKEMKTRAFGQVLTFLYCGALLAERHDKASPGALREEMARLADQFSAARPTFDFKGLGGFFAQWISESPAGIDIGRWIAERARRLAGEIIQARRERAKRVAALLPDGARVLTHCNISGELVAIAQYCREQNKAISVIATETRPYLQGSRLTAWELAEAGIPVSVIPDGAIAQVMTRGAVDAVIVGSDRCAQNGDIVNKVGTYSLALMAKRYGIPFYALVQPPGALRCGSELAIEERPAEELLMFHGRRLLDGGAGTVAVRYPAFDVTPASLVTRLIGFDGSFTPETFKEKFLADASALPPRRDDPRKKYVLVHGVPNEKGYGRLKAAVDQEQLDGILVPEMRPGLWGARVVAPELLGQRLPTVVISDNIMGTLFAAGEIVKCFLFYTRADAGGATAACGALTAAELARAHNVPIELEASAALPQAIDRDVTTFLGRRVLPAGAAVYPLEDDRLPWPA